MGWLAPPCASFSPETLIVVIPCVPMVVHNTFWRRSLPIWLGCATVWVSRFSVNTLFSARHEKRNKGKAKQGVFSEVVHSCMYADVDLKGPPYKKAARLLGSGTWLRDVRKCNGYPLRGQRAKAAGAYPSEFCDLLAAACRNLCHGQA